MAVNNSITKTNSGKPSFAAFIKSEVITNSIQSTLGDIARSRQFTASVISAVNTNTSLKECDYTTIISSALKGESLKLSPSPELGHYYLVPFNNKDIGKVATFQIGLIL